MSNSHVQPGLRNSSSLPTGLAADPPVWPPLAQWTMAFFVAVGLALLGYRGWGMTRYAAEPLTLERAAVDLNEADDVDLELLPGIGPELARRIVERKPYRSVEDLRQVPGIGSATLERVRPHVRVGERIPPRIVRAKPDDKPPPTFGKKQLPEQPIAINLASLEELMQLPGIGPTLAKRIVEGRPYASVEELRRVKGIGAKTLDKVRPFVVVDNDP